MTAAVEVAVQVALASMLADAVTDEAGVAVTDEAEAAVTRSGEVAAGIYDHRPQQADGQDVGVYPYVTIGAIVAETVDTQSSLVWDVAFQLHHYRRENTLKPCRVQQGATAAILHRGNLAVEDHRVLLIDRTRTETRRDNDGTIHGVCDYRALIERLIGV